MMERKKRCELKQEALKVIWQRRERCGLKQETLKVNKGGKEKGKHEAVRGR